MTHMTLLDYQSGALRTLGERRDALPYLALGLIGEAGEATEVIKKYVYHGHEFDRTKLALELGDVLWHIATIAHRAGLTLEEVAQMNLDKLARRYPEGYSDEASRSRL